MAINDIEIFFKLDLKAKELLIKSKPNLYNSSEVDIYKDLLKNIYLFRNIFRQMTSIYGRELFNDIDEKLDEMINDIENCNYDINKMINEYENKFLSLSPELSKELYDNLYGYSLREYIPLDKCNSINDILHLLHFALINDKNVYNSINIISSKERIEKEDNFEYDASIYYRGVENDISKDIYNNFSKDIDCDKTDIMSLPNHTFIMVRGVGHALTIDVTEEGDNVRINYFIPKACNIEKVNKLPGVNKINNPDASLNPTTGEFVTSKENVGSTIANFVRMVPTDKDIERADFSKIRSI